MTARANAQRSQPAPLYPNEPRFEMACVVLNDGIEYFGKWRVLTADEAAALLTQRYGSDSTNWLLQQLLNGQNVDVSVGRRIRISWPWDDQICDKCGGAREVIVWTAITGSTHSVCPTCNADGSIRTRAVFNPFERV